MLSLVIQILPPFLIALVLAYFLHPLVAKLMRIGVTPSIATLSVLTGVCLGFALLCLAILPLLYSQLQWLINGLLQQRSNITNFVGVASSKYELGGAINILQSYWTSVAQHLFSAISGFIPSLISSGMALFNLLAIVCITPVVLYYVLVSWDDFVSAISELVPKKTRSTYVKFVEEIDAILSAYIRGQALVCLIMGTYYGITLAVFGVQNALALGFIAGSLTFIPYVGAATSAVLGATIAAAQYGTWIAVFKVLGVFAVGQFLEGNFVVPRLIGQSLHLHPVWVIFGLLAGGAAFGFVGVVVALPLTAVVAVFIKYSIEQYKKSEIYRK
jgi:predicted PurR-regulated permease PerM